MSAHNEGLDMSRYPVVALAVADWLDGQATTYEFNEAAWTAGAADPGQPMGGARSNRSGQPRTPPPPRPCCCPCVFGVRPMSDLRFNARFFLGMLRPSAWREVRRG